MSVSTWIIGNATVLIGVIGGIFDMIRRQRKFDKQLIEIHVMVNSRLDQLLLQTAASNRLQGADDERLSAAISATKKVP